MLPPKQLFFFAAWRLCVPFDFFRDAKMQMRKCFCFRWLFLSSVQGELVRLDIVPVRVKHDHTLFLFIPSIPAQK